jgi:sugar O-acyltransferase (sialic acid O-acetyltransferase NeuD family)
MTPLVVVGSGGHARELVALGRACGFTVGGLVSDEEPVVGTMTRLGVSWLGPLASVADGDRVMLGHGLPADRAQYAATLSTVTLHFETLVHPSSVVVDDARLAEGVAVHGLCHISTGVDVGRHVHLGASSVLAHDVRLGAFVTLAPRVVLSGGVTVGERVFVGAGVVVVPGCTIGDDAVVSAGAVVTRDVPSGVTAKGVPARW